MDIPIEGTALTVTAVLYQQAQVSLLHEDGSETVTLMEITDTKTGRKGHIYHEIAGRKRDVIEEHVWTDAPELFAYNHPESYAVRKLSHCGPDGTPGERTDVIDDVIAACYDNELTHTAGSPGGATHRDQEWGLYPV